MVIWAQSEQRRVPDGGDLCGGIGVWGPSGRKARSERVEEADPVGEA